MLHKNYVVSVQCVYVTLGALLFSVYFFGFLYFADIFNYCISLALV